MIADSDGTVGMGGVADCAALPNKPDLRAAMSPLKMTASADMISPVDSSTWEIVLPDKISCLTWVLQRIEAPLDLAKAAIVSGNCVIPF